MMPSRRRYTHLASDRTDNTILARSREHVDAPTDPGPHGPGFGGTPESPAHPARPRAR